MIAATAQGSHRIRSIAVVGGFLNDAKFSFTDGLNCLIGARGTGKTTVLEFIRFALDSASEIGPGADKGNRKAELLKRNLAGGRILLEIETKNGLEYVINRCVDEPAFVTSLDGQPSKVTFQSGDVFRADIYSQNQIEEIAEHPRSQLTLLDNLAVAEIAEVEEKLAQLTRRLNSNAEEILPLLQSQSDLQEEVATLPAVEGRLQGFSNEGDGQSDAVEEAYRQKDSRDRERELLSGLSKSFSHLDSGLSEKWSEFEAAVRSVSESDLLEGQNGKLLADLASQLKKLEGVGYEAIRTACKKCEEAWDCAEKFYGELYPIHDQQEAEFRETIEQHQTAVAQADARSKLQRLRGDLLVKQRQLNDVQERIRKLRVQREDLLQQLSEIRDQRFATRQEIVQHINQALMPTIKVSIEQFGDSSIYQRLLEEELKGLGMKHNVVADRIATRVPPQELCRLIRNRDSSFLQEQAELNSTQAEKVFTALNEPATLFQLEIVEMTDKPLIQLRDGETYKNSMSLSTGQKCTSILPILLLDSDHPLLVDQPEDNLDNGFIYETVVESVRHVKQRRQLIFVTHNPNIPVLGEAEKVFVLKSDGSHAWTEEEGTVDECRGNIVKLLEGGEEAFRQRHSKYRY